MAYSDDSLDLESLIYRSSAVCEMSPVALYGLLTKARANNHITQITGVLLYADGEFFQVLEGTREKLDTVIDRIPVSYTHLTLPTKA